MLPRVPLAAGEYKLLIRKEVGLLPCEDPLRCNAMEEYLNVVAPEDLPPMPQALAEAPLP